MSLEWRRIGPPYWKVEIFPLEKIAIVESFCEFWVLFCRDILSRMPSGDWDHLQVSICGVDEHIDFFPMHSTRIDTTGFWASVTVNKLIQDYAEFPEDDDDTFEELATRANMEYASMIVESAKLCGLPSLCQRSEVDLRIFNYSDPPVLLVATV